MVAVRARHVTARGRKEQMVRYGAIFGQNRRRRPPFSILRRLLLPRYVRRSLPEWIGGNEKVILAASPARNPPLRFRRTYRVR